MSASTLILHEDTFYKHFKPYRHPKASYDIWGGLGLETFGADYDLVPSFRSEFIWTVLDGEANDQWIVPGIHYVNRVCYLVTEVPHNDVRVEFRIKHHVSSLTEIGLARQIKRLLACE
jgi:hypothetical protein